MKNACAYKKYTNFRNYDFNCRANAFVPYIYGKLFTLIFCDLGKTNEKCAHSARNACVEKHQNIYIYVYTYYVLRLLNELEIAGAVINDSKYIALR